MHWTMIHQILHQPLWPVIFILAGICLCIAIIIPLLLKLLKKTDGVFRSKFLSRGFSTGVALAFVGMFLIGESITIKDAIIFVCVIATVFLLVALVMGFIDWIEKD